MYRTSAQAHGRPHQGHQESINGYDAHDGGDWRTDGHANSDFALPLESGVVQHPVQADASEHRRHDAEE